MRPTCHSGEPSPYAHGGGSAPLRWEEWFINRAIEGVLTIDAAGLVRSINPAAEQIFRCPASKAIGQPFDRFIPQRHRDAHVQHVAAFAGSTAHSQEMVGRDPLMALRDDGEEFAAEISVVRLGAGASAGFACLVRDVTEKRQAEEAILHARKLESLGVLTAGIAHDFNNILASLLGNAAFVLGQLPPDSPVREAVEDIESAGERAAELVRQLVQFSGNTAPHRRPVDLNLLVRETVRLLRATTTPACNLDTTLDLDLPPVHADSTGVRRVIMNLVINAAEAIGARPGEVNLSTSLVHADRRFLRASELGRDLHPGTYACLAVSDNGPGLEPSVRAKMFDPYFTTRFPGRGLGLANVLGIVRAHGGAIRVTSRPGRGATFRVLLPLAADLRSEEARASL